MIKRCLAVVAASLAAAVVLVGPMAAGADAAIRIGKIQYNSPGVDNWSNTSLNAEYVTIKNTGGTRRNLRGWTLRDAQGHVYRFATTYYLPRYSSVRIHTGHGTNTIYNRYWGMSNYVWNNTGDTATLRNAAGSYVDSCRWTSAGSGVIYC